MASTIGRVRFRYLRHTRDGRIAYALQRPNGITELRFMARR
jgi:hypothetical protein